IPRPPTLRGEIDEAFDFEHELGGLALDFQCLRDAGVFRPAFDFDAVLAGVQLQAHPAGADEVIEPEGQVRGPLRLAGRVLEMYAAGHGLPALLVADDDLDLGGVSRGNKPDQDPRSEHQATSGTSRKHGGLLGAKMARATHQTIYFFRCGLSYRQ